MRHSWSRRWMSIVINEAFMGQKMEDLQPWPDSSSEARWRPFKSLVTKEGSDSQEVIMECTVEMPLSRRLTIIVQYRCEREIEKWRFFFFFLVWCFWSRLAGYPNLRLYLDPMIRSLLVLCKLQLDLALFLVLHGDFLKKNELWGIFSMTCYT